MLRRNFVTTCAALVIGVGLGHAAVVSNANAADRIFFGVATGSTGGVYYPLGGMIAQVISNHAKAGDTRIIATAETGNASVANARLLQNAEIEAGMMGADIANQAYNGKAQFKDSAVKNMRAIGALFPETVQLVVRADSDIKSFNDLKGKTVSSGPAGSGMYQFFGDMLEAHGMSRKDISEDFSTFTQSAEKLRDGNLDAFFAIGGVPTVSIQDLAQGHPVRIVPLEGAGVDKVLKEQPYYAKVTLAGGTYNGQDTDVTSMAVRAVLSTHEKMSTDVIYEVTKAIYENSKTLAKVHVQGRNVKLETALQSISIPLHPGAEKYYKEKGLLK